MYTPLLKNIPHAGHRYDYTGNYFVDQKLRLPWKTIGIRFWDCYLDWTALIFTARKRKKRYRNTGMSYRQAVLSCIKRATRLRSRHVLSSSSLIMHVNRIHGGSCRTHVYRRIDPCTASHRHRVVSSTILLCNLQHLFT